jgi:hydroxyacylglutathione hydrolase
LQIKQIKVGFDNFSYVIYSKKTKKAAIVDPGFGADKLLIYIINNNLDILYIIITHYHSDHTSDVNKLKNKNPYAKIVASKYDGKGFDAEVFVTENYKLKVGDANLKFIMTPGHTPGGICIIVDDKAIITGDTLFIGDCGRTDLLGGSLSEMFDSLQKIKKLPDELIVYPGHDYGDLPFDTLGNQKKKNKTLLAKNLEEFSRIT